MRKLCLIVSFCALAPFAGAQEETVDLDGLMQSAERWAKENLDDDALRVLQNVDREQVNQFFATMQKQFHGQYVVDLGPLKSAAKSIVPLLEGYEETLPYAIWLKTRLDYLEVADQFRLIIPVPKVEPGQPPKPAPNPAPEKEREIWIEKLTPCPWPKSAKNYVPLLKPVFVAEKAPPQLVWIAEVESSFDPRARSPVGALGLFQLMPATARRFGLRTGVFDQRLNPEQSARAAAKYLAYLRSRFKDWRLALAAYNAGEGTVDKLLARHKARTFDDIAIYLPAETQLYVPKVEATVWRRENMKLRQL